jgi:hypothetical protein
LVGVEVDQQTRTPRSPALEELAGSASFAAAIEEQARGLRRDADELAEEWLGLLDRVAVSGRRPRSAADYMFVMEAVRRALGIG